MTKLALLAAAATIAAAAPVFANSPVRPVTFERDGISYTATVTERADGVRLIQGRETQTGRVFVLRVTGQHVTGEYNGAAVAYDMPGYTTIAAR